MIDPNEIRLESMKQYGFGTDAMKELKICKRCGAMNPATRRHCKECHGILPGETLYQVYRRRHTICPQCEVIISDAVQYCPQCGIRILEKDHA